jgi:polyhydroxybutyrate depolymerase
VTFNAGGDRGSYLIAVPPAAKPPLPVVFDLHGYLESASEQETITGLSQFGITHGFITVTPQVTETVPHWNFAPGSSDLAFLGALVDHIEASQCVNTQRVYVAGYSNGAFMTSYLACHYAGRIAAIATIAGIQAPAHCHASRPVPVIAFHGTADPFVPYNGGVGPAAASLPGPNGTGTLGSLIRTPAVAGVSPATAPIPTEQARWAARNGCSSPPRQSTARCHPDRLPLP